jgi:hypothetical protein
LGKIKMDLRKAYINLSLSMRMLVILPRIYTFFVILFSSFHFIPLSAQDKVEYDEIPVFLDVPRLGGTDMTAVIRGEELYLPVTDLFDFLKIKNVPTTGLESVSGFFINPDAAYLISRTDNIIRYQDKTYNLEPGDLIRTESNLYLRSSYFGKVFGLDCKFNFRSLSVTVNSKLELPLIREMRQEEMRKNLTRLKGEVVADTSIGRSYPLFKFGMADWSVNASEEINGVSETRLNLALGAMIAGGEATASLYYNSPEPFTEKQQHYLWRYVNNDFNAVRQVMAGKISTNSISTIYNPVVGIQVTNTPTTYRRSFGSYTLSDRTEPGWLVELYVNNVLVDYVKADPSGFFTFKVPLVYGSTIVKLKFYGPWGEERIREQYISIPFNFLPEKTLEYTASAGIVEDTLMSRFSRANVNYGLSKNITLGGGVEYLSSVTSRPAMPFLDASLRITNNMLLSGEYTFGVRAKGTFSFSLPSNLQLDLNYTWYDKNQKAINFNYREERKATLSMPLHIAKISTYQRFSVYQIVLPASNYTTAEWLFSGMFFGVNSNFSTYGIFNSSNDPYYYSNLSLAFRLPAGFVLMPEAQFGYNKNGFISSKIRLEKTLLEHAYLNLSYEQYFISSMKLAEVGFRYDFSFAQTGVSVRQSDKKTTFVQYARGSIINDSKSKYVGANNRTNVGKGAISITAFIDINLNGYRDGEEPKIDGLNIRANGGQIEKRERDSTIRIIGLEPYTSCFIELDPNSFDNLSWRLPYQTMSVSVDPNIMKNIEIPIIVVGEASGNIALYKDGETKGLGRIIVSFFSTTHKPVGKTLTEDNGYFSYFGLTQGKYSVRVDTAQMRKLGMISEPDSLQFDILPGAEGDFVENLDFILKMKPGITPVISEKPVSRKDSTIMIIHEVTQELVTISEDSWAIQFGAFRQRSYAEFMRRKLEAILGRKVEIIIEDNFYKVRISEIKTRKEVDDTVAVLKKYGVTELWIISQKAKKQQWVLKEKRDTVTTITENIIGNIPIVPSPQMILGAFRLWSNAIALRQITSANLDKKLSVEFADGYYKVNVSGVPKLDESVLDAMKRLEPLDKLKFKDFYVIPFQPLPEEEPAVLIRETPPRPADRITDVPYVTKPDTISGFKESKIVAPVVPKEPTISLQVGVFYKKSEALRAQRRIISKLNLPVEIVQQWDAYRVIITGFFTREETYKYYPELAGLGYPGVMIIDNK